MNRTGFFSIALALSGFIPLNAEEGNIGYERTDTIGRAVVTGTRNETDMRHLPMTVSVVDRKVLENSGQTSVLPVLNAMVPGFFLVSKIYLRGQQFGSLHRQMHHIPHILPEP